MIVNYTWGRDILREIQNCWNLNVSNQDELRSNNEKSSEFTEIYNKIFLNVESIEHIINIIWNFH